MRTACVVHYTQAVRPSARLPLPTKVGRCATGLPPPPEVADFSPIGNDIGCSGRRRPAFGDDVVGPPAAARLAHRPSPTADVSGAASFVNPRRLSTDQ